DEDLRQRVLARHGRYVRLDAGPRVLGWGDLSAGRDGAADGIHAVRAGHQLSHRSCSGRSLAQTAVPFPDLTPLSCSNAKRGTCTKKQPACEPSSTTADLAAPLACTLAPVFWCCYHAASRTGYRYGSFAVKHQARCSEQSRRKTVTQSYGTTATRVAKSAGPPATLEGGEMLAAISIVEESIHC